MADGPAPRFAIRDEVSKRFLRQDGDGDSYVPCTDHESVTFFDDEIDAEWASMNIEGNTKVVRFNPVPGVTKGY
jgi:hypothetical protein